MALIGRLRSQAKRMVVIPEVATILELLCWAVAVARRLDKRPTRDLIPGLKLAIVSDAKMW